MSPAWYALRVRSNFEQTTAAFLTSIGYEVFLPTYRERRRWSDRVKEIDAPLFSGYVFCRLDIDKHQPVVRCPGFVNIVSAGPTFLSIPESEIATLQMIVTSPVFRKPWPYLCMGEKVAIVHGPLAGIEGILLEQKGQNRLVVSVHLLQRSIAAEIDLDWVRPLKDYAQIAFPAARAHLTESHQL